MCRSEQQHVEDRIFELLDSDRTGREICAELGLDPKSGIELIIKVLRERGTPNLAAARRELDALAEIHL